MTLLKLKYKTLLLVILAVSLGSCSNPWDDRANNGDTNLDHTLSEAITNSAETAEFGKLLVQTGYDKILAASKTYTVFAPTNEAIKAVDPSILNNPESLKKFVENHIALTSFSSVRKDPEEKIFMLSNKYLTFKGSTSIGDATIVKADQYAANGVFHIVNKALAPKLNIWEYVNSQAATSEMSAYLLSLTQFSIYKEDIDAKANTKPGFLADSLSNSYLRNVYNLNNEKNSYTLFLMQNDGYNAEVTKMKPYLIKPSNVPTTDSTAIYSKYFTVRDMAFPKAYTKSTLPAELTSRFGVKFNVDKTQIVGEPIVLSNGIVYIMKKVDVDLKKRLVPTRIEGEGQGKNYNNLTFYNGTREKILYRDKKDPSGILFNDVMVTPATALFTLQYKAVDLYSTVTYQVYWRAINDRQTNVFQQRLTIAEKTKYDGTTTTPVNTIVSFAYKDVPINLYTPVYIGDFTLTKSGNLDAIWLIGGNTTTSGSNTLSLDYLDFIPVVK